MILLKTLVLTDITKNDKIKNMSRIVDNERLTNITRSNRFTNIKRTYTGLLEFMRCTGLLELTEHI